MHPAWKTSPQLFSHCLVWEPFVRVPPFFVVLIFVVGAMTRKADVSFLNGGRLLSPARRYYWSVSLSVRRFSIMLSWGRLITLIFLYSAVPAGTLIVGKGSTFESSGELRVTFIARFCIRCSNAVYVRKWILALIRGHCNSTPFLKVTPSPKLYWWNLKTIQPYG